LWSRNCPTPTPPPPSRRTPIHGLPPAPLSPFSDGDEVHLAHVIPRVQTVALHGAPPVDFLPEQVKERRGGGKCVCVCVCCTILVYHETLLCHLHPRSQDPVAYEQLIKNAEAFIAARFLPRLAPLRPDPVIHIIKSEVDADSVGNVVCMKAGALGAAALVMASHTKSKLAELFLGSVTNYCTHHSPVPVLVVK